MIEDLPVNVDKTTFLAWVQTQERKRFELVEGKVIEAELHTLGHARVVTGLLGALGNGPAGNEYDVLLSFGVDTGPNTIRDPDVVVDRGGNLKDIVANAPLLLAEVLSPNFVTIDLGDKPAEYLRIPSLLSYLVFSQDEPKAWIWIRNETGKVVGPRVVAGYEEAISVSALGIELRLSDIYTDIFAMDRG